MQVMKTSVLAASAPLTHITYITCITCITPLILARCRKFPS